MTNKKYFILIIIFELILFDKAQLFAQYTMGNTGLLHMPTADMQKDGSVLIGSNYMNKHNMPTSWTYDTYNYFLNVTFLPFIEVAYTCHLMSFGKWGKNGKYFNNQDRSFSGRIRLLKEKQFWKYMPALVVGTNDPLSGHNGGGGIIINQGEDSHNYFARYYIVATKHIEVFRFGKMGCHIAYIHSRGTGFQYKGIAIGLNYSPFFHQNLNLIGEYDAHTFNCGFQYILLKHLICTFELQDFKYISGGVTLRIHLKK